MGLPCARQEDTVLGTCYNNEHITPYSFVGTIIGGAAKSKINNLNIAQETNMVQCD